MRIKVLTAALALATTGVAGMASADEGMWVPQQLPEIAGPLQKAGLELDPQQLADLTGDPMGAVQPPASSRRRAWWLVTTIVLMGQSS